MLQIIYSIPCVGILGSMYINIDARGRWERPKDDQLKINTEGA